jgi:hypothetical protein
MTDERSQFESWFDSEYPDKNTPQRPVFRAGAWAAWLYLTARAAPAQRDLTADEQQVLGAALLKSAQKVERTAPAQPAGERVLLSRVKDNPRDLWLECDESELNARFPKCEYAWATIELVA